MRWLVPLVLAGCVTVPTVSPPPPTREPVCPTTAPVASGDASALRGATIEKVCLVGAGDDDYLRLHEAVAPREGTPLDDAPIRADIEQLYALGLVNDVVVVAEPLPSKGVLLSYVVEPFDVIAELSVQGVTALRVDEVQRPGLRASPQVIKALGEQVRQLLVERGYARAEVSASATRVEPGKAKVLVTAVEGQKLTVRGIRLVGRSAVPERELRGVLRSRVGEAFAQETVDADVVALTGACLDHGLLTSAVTVRHDEAADGAVELTFVITEGPVFRVGALSTTGVSLGDEAAVLRALETKPKAVFSRAAMRRDLDRLEHFARQRGVAVDITPLTTLNPEKKTIDLVLELAKRADGTLRF